VRKVDSTRVNENHRLLVFFVDLCETGGVAHEEPVESTQELIVLCLKRGDEFGRHELPCIRIDVFGFVADAVHNVSVSRQGPVSDVDIKSNRLEIGDHGNVEVHAKNPHLEVLCD